MMEEAGTDNGLETSKKNKNVIKNTVLQDISLSNS